MRNIYSENGIILPNEWESFLALRAFSRAMPRCQELALEPHPMLFSKACSRRHGMGSPSRRRQRRQAPQSQPFRSLIRRATSYGG